MYDLIIRDGVIVDTVQRTLHRGDVAVSGGVISAIGDLAGHEARATRSARGLYVTPALVDLHTHVYRGGSFWGIDPTPVAWRSGVTTWVDAGSAGAHTIDSLAAQTAAYDLTTHALLHIAAQGLVGRTGESADLANLDVDAFTDAVSRHPSLVRGVKVRIDPSTVGTNHLLPLDRALTAGRATGLPVMVHIGAGSIPVAETLDKLRPGDIVTHCAGPAVQGFGSDPVLRTAIRRAYENGVVFDIGHGAGGFLFSAAEEYLSHGLGPHVISSDLHQLSIHGPVFDLPTVMSKLLAIGMELVDVVAAATVAPARALGIPGGTIEVGKPADLALFRVETTPEPLGDVYGDIRPSTQRLYNEATYRAGRLLPPRWPDPPPSTLTLSTEQKRALDELDTAARALLTRNLVHPSHVRNQIPRP